MEQLFINNGSGQGYGFILYRKTIGEAKKIMFPGKVRDRALIILNGDVLETVDCSMIDKVVCLPTKSGKNVLDILVENLGRVNYASFNSPILNDQRKGLRTVLLDGKVAQNWVIYPLEMKRSFIERLMLYSKWSMTPSKGPSMCWAILKITDHPKDTFIDTAGWKKGIVFINGFNIGRYWEIGPQKTLYVPAPLLSQGDNQILVFELHQPSEKLCTVAEPQLGEIILHKTTVPAWAKSLLFVLKNTLRLGSWVWTILRPFVK